MASVIFRSARALIILLMVSGASPADGSAAVIEASGLELFTAFKTFCVDTEANPDAVKAAVEAAGGMFKTQNSLAVPPSTAIVIGWDLVLGDHHLLVTAATEHVPASPTEQERDTKHCFIDSDRNEDASLAAIREWVAVPPTQAAGNVTIYSYQVAGSVRTIMNPGSSEKRLAKIEGRERMLALIINGDSASVQLNHYRYGPIPPGFVPSKE